MATDESRGSRAGVTVIPTGGCYDCGGRCVLKVHVRDGVAIRVETDDGEEPQLRACLRGRAYRKQVYSPDRLRTPLKRVGPRGEGAFEPVSWDEALDKVASELRRVKDTYGPRAILMYVYSAAATGLFHNGFFALQRILQKLGGYMEAWGAQSSEASQFAARATYGTMVTGNSKDDLLNSKLIIFWGVNPATSIFGTNSTLHLMQAKEAGARVVFVDPVYSQSAAVFGDQWVPIRPATDAAMLLAMAYVMITENLHDQTFLDRYTVGFESFREYLTGSEDGVAKTPSWAAEITGVDAATIVDVARQYATQKPAALICGIAPARTAFGEQTHRAASALAAMTGNVGRHGGGAAAMEMSTVGPIFPSLGSYDATSKALDVRSRLRTRVHKSRLWDAIIRGADGGYPSDIKMAYIACANPLNQLPNLYKGVEALKKLEFTVVQELFMTSTARYADIVLPVASLWEKNDVSRPWQSGPYFLFLNKVIEPLHDVKSDLEIFRELAVRLGISDPESEESEEEGIRRVLNSYEDMREEITDFEKFKTEGVHKIKRTGPAVAFKSQIDDPVNNPFPTPSGKIEIYCQRIVELNNPEIPPIPKYIEPWEGPRDPLVDKYPLQLVTPQHKGRAHSCFDNNSWLRQVAPQALWMSVADAEGRGIRNGDHVRVFNDRGETLTQVKVTTRVMPGVVSLAEGADFRPDAKGRDRAGSSNVLTRDQYSPGGAFAANSSLVQVEKFQED